MFWGSNGVTGISRLRASLRLLWCVCVCLTGLYPPYNGAEYLALLTMSCQLYYCIPIVCIRRLIFWQRFVVTVGPCAEAAMIGFRGAETLTTARERTGRGALHDRSIFKISSQRGVVSVRVVPLQ